MVVLVLVVEVEVEVDAEVEGVVGGHTQVVVGWSMIWTFDSTPQQLFNFSKTVKKVSSQAGA